MANVTGSTAVAINHQPYPTEPCILCSNEMHTSGPNPRLRNRKYCQPCASQVPEGYGVCVYNLHEGPRVLPASWFYVNRKEASKTLKSYCKKCLGEYHYDYLRRRKENKHGV